MSRPVRSVIALLLAALVVLAVGSTAHAQTPPANDNFLFAKDFNAPGTPLTRLQQLPDTQNLKSATMQANLLAPCAADPCGVAGAEEGSCGSTTYTNTVWYRFFPEAGGAVGFALNTDGFSPAVSIYPLGADGTPEGGRCWNPEDSDSEVWQKVRGGVGYAVQIGSWSVGAGKLDLKFFYSPRASRTVDNFKVAYTVRKSGSKFKLSRILVKGVRRHEYIQLYCAKCLGGRVKRSVRRGDTMTFTISPAATLSASASILFGASLPGHNGRYRFYGLNPAGPSQRLLRRGCMPPGMRLPSQALVDLNFAC